MYDITREIFRSWNWPDNGNCKYSHRPTPYNISKFADFHPSSVYRRFNELFDFNFVRKVIYLPTDPIVKRKALVFTGAKHEDISEMVSKMEEFPFLEMIHYAHVYRSFGGLEHLNIGDSIIFAEIIGTREVDIIARSRKLLDVLGEQVRITVLPPSKTNKESTLDPKLVILARNLSYRDIYTNRLSDIAAPLNVSPRTAERLLDSLLSRNMLIAFPLLNQSEIKGFNVAVVSIPTLEDVDPIALKKLIMGLPMLSQRYLLYRLIDGTLNLLLYYEAPKELDECVDELSPLFRTFAVLTRFETYMNDHIILR